ncbi:MAG: AraC family transcriptional regulator [Cyanobacteria bacterium J06659_2]
MASDSRYQTVTPSLSLRDFISHYWLSLDNPDTTYVALPDGAVDLVIQVNGASVGSWIYGTTTARVDITLAQPCYYLGIRFKAGQSRHFLNASARELTDRAEITDGLLQFGLEEVPEYLTDGSLADRLNHLLESHLAKQQPSHHRIDDVIHWIAINHGRVSVGEAAELFGKSRRQFERVFLETVGVSAKFFATVMRFQQATALMTPPFRLPLAAIAAELGYTDQSHMSHEFKRLANVSPARFMSEGVAFLQDRHGH